MRDFQDFSLKEWLALDPLIHSLKQRRNDAKRDKFTALRVSGQDAYLQQIENLKDKSIAIVVAFNQPWAIDWLTRMVKRHVPDTTFLVFDNSLDPDQRPKIEKICRERDVPYLELPANPERHPCRSHAIAMNWVYQNVVQQVKPKQFAYIDHDLIPLTHVDFSERLGDQTFFGCLNPSKWGYNLWAGYCIYDYHAHADQPLDFNHDVTMGLDTGGRNWPFIYSKVDRSTIRLTDSKHMDVVNPTTGETRNVEIMDERWLHLCGAGYHHTYNEKFSFYEGIAKATDEGATITDLVPSLESMS